MWLNMLPHRVILFEVYAFQYERCVIIHIDNALPRQLYTFSYRNILWNVVYSMCTILNVHSTYHIKQVQTHTENALPVQLHMLTYWNILVSVFCSMFAILNVHSTYHIKKVKTHIENALSIRQCILSYCNTLADKLLQDVFPVAEHVDNTCLSNCLDGVFTGSHAIHYRIHMLNRKETYS